jgi:hypothetical protein
MVYWLTFVAVACLILRNPRSEFSARVNAAVDVVRHSDEEIAGHKTLKLSAKSEREGDAVPI